MTTQKLGATPLEADDSGLAEHHPPVTGHGRPRSRAQTLLREALAEHQSIFDNAFVGICYVRERIIVRCNRRFEEMFGYSGGELPGQSVAVCYPSLEDFDRIGRIGYGYLRHHDTYSDERLMRRKDGEQFWCRVSGRRMNRANPERSCVWIFQDITVQKRAESDLQSTNERLEHLVSERTADLRAALDALREEIEHRKKTEAELRASQEKYRALFESFPIGISITNAEGQVIEVNELLRESPALAGVRGATGGKATVAAAPLLHLDGRQMAPEEHPAARALQERQVISNVEAGVRCSPNKVRWFRVTAAPIPVSGYGAMVAYADITEQKRIEERERQHRSELARVSRLNTMGEMAAALAHELGQPLSATLNYLHGCQLRLSLGEWEPELFGSALSQAIYHAERSGKIIQRIRQFVRRHDPESVATDLNALIDQVMGFLEVELRESQASVKLALDPHLPVVHADPLEIQQVLINLVKNALEATLDLPQERRILEISSETQGGTVAIAVTDRGPGVAKKDLTQIFDAFYSTKRNGIGLGLAVCRSIIESHGGRLSVVRNVFGGATFRFTLPQGS